MRVFSREEINFTKTALQLGSRLDGRNPTEISQIEYAAGDEVLKMANGGCSILLGDGRKMFFGLKAGKNFII